MNRATTFLLHCLTLVALLVLFALACRQPPERQTGVVEISLARNARVQEKELLNLDLGEVGTRGPLRSGWSYSERRPEGSFVWGIGSESILEVESAKPSDLVINMEANPFPAPEPQVVTLEFNGAEIEEYALRDDDPLPVSIFVSQEHVLAGSNRVKLRYSRFRKAKDRLGRPLRRYAVAWDRIRITQPSRLERSGENLYLPAGETLVMVFESDGETHLSLDGLLGEGEVQAIEVVRSSIEGDGGEVLLGKLVPSSPATMRITKAPGETRLLLRAFGSPGSGFRLLAPKIKGRLRRIHRPNVILISIDTLRADHLTPYGYDKPTSPSLGELVEDSVLFEKALSHGPSTLISHASLFSSLLPQHHGASFHFRRKLSEEAITLTEVLREAGYRCASINGGGQIDPAFGLDQGFELYDPKGGYFYNVVRRGERWVEENSDAPFFLFLHTYEVHHPYRPRMPDLERFDEGYDGPLPSTISKELLEQINAGELEVDEADLRYIVATYDALISSMDRALELLVHYLRANGLYDSTLVVFTSDHGEEFGEHGWMGWHSHSLFDELLHVPLVLKLPGAHEAGRSVDAPVRLIDVAPTILDILGLEAPETFDGRSLLPLIDGSSLAELPAVGMIDESKQEYFSIRQDAWKWLNGRLYDLRTDPSEQNDLARSNPAKAREMRRKLENLLERRSPLKSQGSELSDETQERLRALGYL